MRHSGSGFGWQDVDVWKLGAAYQYNKQWTLRAGYNHGDNPIQARDVTFNILAPGVVKDHATLGVTYLTNAGNELTVSYMHAFENTVTGPTIAALAAPEQTPSKCTKIRLVSLTPGRCKQADLS